MKLSLNKKMQGFTLIELLIVIAILAILAGIILLILNPAEQRAKAGQSFAKATARNTCSYIAAQIVSDPTYSVSGDTNISNVAPSTGLPAGVEQTALGVNGVTYSYTATNYDCAFTCDPTAGGVLTETGSNCILN